MKASELAAALLKTPHAEVVVQVGGDYTGVTSPGVTPFARRSSLDHEMVEIVVANNSTPKYEEFS